MISDYIALIADFDCSGRPDGVYAINQLQCLEVYCFCISGHTFLEVNIIH